MDGTRTPRQLVAGRASSPVCSAVNPGRPFHLIESESAPRNEWGWAIPPRSASIENASPMIMIEPCERDPADRCTAGLPLRHVSPRSSLLLAKLCTRPLSLTPGPRVWFGVFAGLLAAAAARLVSCSGLPTGRAAEPRRTRRGSRARRPARPAWPSPRRNRTAPVPAPLAGAPGARLAYLELAVAVQDQHADGVSGHQRRVLQGNDRAAALASESKIASTTVLPDMTSVLSRWFRHAAARQRLDRREHR